MQEKKFTHFCQRRRWRTIWRKGRIQRKSSNEFPHPKPSISWRMMTGSISIDSSDEHIISSDVAREAIEIPPGFFTLARSRESMFFESLGLCQIREYRKYLKTRKWDIYERRNHLVPYTTTLEKIFFFKFCHNIFFYKHLRTPPKKKHFIL